MKEIANVLRRPIKIASCIAAVSTGVWSVCNDWSWEEDLCVDVNCPVFCYQWGYGNSQSDCFVDHSTDPPTCCNCWFRERKCKFVGTNEPCYRQSPPAPNPYSWECFKQIAAAECQNEMGVYGKVCLTAEDPWPAD